jgi:hypothetical protein
MTRKKSASPHSIADEFKNVPIKDKRIVKRLAETAETLAKCPGGSIPGACQSRAKTKATYRLFSNEKVDSVAILKGHRGETIKRMKQYDVALSVQDTTLCDFTSHPGTEGLGPTGSEGLIGLLAHTALAVTTNGIPLGILAQKIWARDPDESKTKVHRKKRPIEEKESYKWFELMDQSLDGTPKNTMVVTVGDREADIYELFHKATSEKKHVLIRSIYDRCVDHEQKKLCAQVKSTDPLGKCMVRIPRNTELNLPPRTVWLMIQSCKVKLCAPFIKGKSLDNITLTAILAREIAPPQGVKPVEWLLLTTLDVETAEEAFEKVRWYSHRWKIERFHYVLKSGCKIQELQLETAERLKNAIALYSFLAWRIIWITYQARETPDLSCTLILEDHEWKILYREVNGISRLPKKPPTLKQAVVLIARLGGFLARKSDGAPGVKVLWRGFRELHSISKAYLHLRSHPI